MFQQTRSEVKKQLRVEMLKELIQEIDEKIAEIESRLPLMAPSTLGELGAIGVGAAAAAASGATAVGALVTGAAAVKDVGDALYITNSKINRDIYLKTVRKKIDSSRYGREGKTEELMMIANKYYDDSVQPELAARELQGDERPGDLLASAAGKTLQGALMSLGAAAFVALGSWCISEILKSARSSEPEMKYREIIGELKNAHEEKERLVRKLRMIEQDEEPVPERENEPEPSSEGICSIL